MKSHEIHNPHDLFFKESWANVKLARSFLQEYLPPNILARISLDSLAICKDSFIEPDMKQYYSDVLYQAKLGDHSGFVYFLFEHKSHPDKLIFIQLLRYMLSIWDLYIKQAKGKNKTTNLPIVLPLVLYHGKKSWNMPQRFSRCFQGLSEDMAVCVPDFSYQLYDLSRYTDEQIKGEVMTQLALRILKHAFDDDLLEKLPDIGILLKELNKQDTGLQYFATLLTYLSGLSSLQSATLADVKTVLSESLSPEQGEYIMTIAEKLRQEGRQEGRQENKITFIQRMLEQGLDIAVISKCAGMTVEELQNLITRFSLRSV